MNLIIQNTQERGRTKKMAEYIEREALLKFIEENNTDSEWMVNQYNADWIYSFIDSAPAADVAEVKHGEWKPYKTPIETRQSGWICTNCSGVINDLSNGNTNFCPNCGALMEDEA